MSDHDANARGAYVEPSFERDTRYINTRITADGREGWPVEPGRYRLVVARACPWANRTIIVRRLLGLEDAISMGMCGPTHDARSWTFDLDPDGLDPVLGIERLQQYLEVYEAELGSMHPEVAAGYQNLLKLATTAFLDGFYYRPRIDNELLAQHSEGLICLSACLASEVSDLILRGNEEQAFQRIGWHQEVFGKGNYYLELQDHGDLVRYRNIWIRPLQPRT